MVKRKIPGKSKAPINPLKAVCVIGLVLALIISWGIVFFILARGKDIPGRGKTQVTTFARELSDYDLYNAPKRALEGVNPEEIEKRLSALQKKVQGVEEQLSVLKRRRALALADRRYIPAYKEAALAAATAFAYSAPLAAVAAESVALGGIPLSEDDTARLKSYAQRISQNRFDSVELGIHALAGELEDPAQAAALPGLENLLSLDLPSVPEQTRKNLLIDEFLLRAIKRDIPAASLRLDTLLTGADPEIISMEAEFFYDHQNPLKAAELFLRSAGEMDLARAADALVIAGEIPGARNIWLALSSQDKDGPGSSPGIVSRSLYNLASSSADQGEEASWLEKIFTLGSVGSQGSQAQGFRPGGRQGDSTEIYSIIRYTRLLDTSRSIAILGGEDMKRDPLLDLELLRRSLETWPPKRAAAEVWLLLGRNPEDEALYEWAAWYFDYQRLYTESAQLLKEAVRKGMSGSWIDLHRSFALLRDGKTAEGEKILKEALRTQGGSGSVDWRIPANLGRIQESRRAISSAIEYYEAAAALVKEKPAAALVQLRLSRCLQAVGRSSDSRKALEYAAELDPDNLNIRREIRAGTAPF